MGGGGGKGSKLSLVETILPPLSQPKIVSERLFYGVSTGQELARVVSDHPGKGGVVMSQNKGGHSPAFLEGWSSCSENKKASPFASQAGSRPPLVGGVVLASFWGLPIAVKRKKGAENRLKRLKTTPVVA